MKKAIAFVCAAACLLVIGCDSSELPASGYTENLSVTEIESTLKYKIYVHNPTGVHYIVYKGGECNGAFTVMLNADGTPYTGS